MAFWLIKFFFFYIWDVTRHCYSRRINSNSAWFLYVLNKGIVKLVVCNLLWSDTWSIVLWIIPNNLNWLEVVILKMHFFFFLLEVLMRCMSLLLNWRSSTFKYVMMVILCFFMFHVLSLITFIHSHSHCWFAWFFKRWTTFSFMEILREGMNLIQRYQILLSYIVLRPILT